MRKAIITLFTICILLSCGRGYRVAMDIAQSQMMSAPDSSLTILQGIDRQALPTQGLRARHVLLLTMARDKCYMDVSQDTTIRVAYDWYQRHGSKQDRLLSAYYLGVVQQQAGYSLEAALAFREAEPLAEELEDYRQMSLVEQHLSEIYYNNYDEGRALNYARESLRYAELAEEPVMTDYCRYDVAVRLLSMFHYEEAEILLSQVLRNNKNNHSLYSFAAQKMAEVCFFKNNPDIESARKYYREIEEIGVLQLGCHDYGIQAGLCEYENESSAADRDLKKAESLVKTSVDSILFYNDCRNVYDKRGDWKLAHDFKTKSVVIQNRTVIQLLEQSLTHALERYYEDKWVLERIQSRYRLYLFVFLGILMFGLCVLLVLFVLRRNRVLLEDMAKTLDLSKELVNTLISDKIQGLQQLSESYFSWEDESVKKREEKKGRFSRDEIIASFRSQLNALRKDQSFVATLEQSLNFSDNGIMIKVRQILVNEKELDYSILTLLFSGFSIKSISYLLRMSEASLRMRKTRYKQRFESLPERERIQFLAKLGVL